MPTTGAAVPGWKAEGKKGSRGWPAGSIGQDPSEIPKLRGTSRMLNRIRHVSSSPECSFVPEEIFQSLTCASSSLSSPGYLRSPQTTKAPVGFKGCLQTADRLWHYPNSWSKFRHLTDHPVSLTGAGRDVSYLCDVSTGQEAKKATPGRKSSNGSCRDLRGSRDTVPRAPRAVPADTLIPKEFHIVKNRGVLPLKHFDDKYTTLLEDREKKMRLFPSMRPSGRLEVIHLMEVMDSMLEKAGVDKLIRVTGPSQLHNLLELMKAEQNIYNIVFHEVIRRVSVECVERGQLLSKLSSSPSNEKLLGEILEDINNLINMLKENLQQYAGEVHLRKMESLRSAANLPEHWTELALTVLNRRRDFAAALHPQHTALEEINQRAHELYQQYNTRISGNNGTARFLTALVRSMEDWLFKVQKPKQGSGMHEAELQALYCEIPAWLAQVDAVMSCMGSSQLHEVGSEKKLHFPVVPKEFFQMIQRWVLSMNNEVEKNTTHLNKKVTELHRNLMRWLVNLLRHIIADRLSSECPQRQETDTEMDEELRLLRAHKVQHEAEELVAEMGRLSGATVSCCRELVNAIIQKKRSEMDLEADFELEELNKIKELQLKLKLKDTTVSSTQEEFEAEDANRSRKPLMEEEILEAKEEIAIIQSGAGKDSLTDGNEATADMIRYVGHDANIHLKSLKSDIMSVTGREMTATKLSTPFSQKEFEALAMLEHLQMQLLEAEIRAQNAEERSEGLEEKLGEALQRIKKLESELEKEGKVMPEATYKEGQEKLFQESVSEASVCLSPKSATSGQSKGSRKSKH